MPSTGSVSRSCIHTSSCSLIDAAFYYTFKFVLILWMSLPQTAYVTFSLIRGAHTDNHSGAQIIFRSFMQPVFSRYFSESGSTAANLRGKVDAAGKPHAN